MKRRITLVALLLLGFGAARLAPEEALARTHREAFFKGAKLDLALREKVGQLGFVAALSGFRSLVADLLWIQAHAAWERTEWGRMALLLDQVVTLQPRAILFWDLAAWHMAWNASVAAFNNPKQPREALRIKAQREYFALGRSFLERGIKNNPDRYQLYDRLGLLLRDKFQDHCGAAEAYLQAMRFPDAPPYVKRFAAYELAACPGREREAYAMLRSFYLMGEQERLPTLLKWIGELEPRLGIPETERLYTAPPPAP